MNGSAMNAAAGVILVVISILNWFPPYTVDGLVMKPVSVITAITTMFIGLCLVVPAVVESR